jgi:hypothetical protein
MAFFYMRPSEIASYNATVTTSAGATDSDYTDDWITDARMGRPARSTNGTVTWALSFASSEVGLVCVGNCNASVNASITGGVSATVVAGTLDEDGIRVNGFATVTPANITALSVGFSANPGGAVVLGELLAGKYRTLTYGLRQTDGRLAVESYGIDPRAEFASMNSYDKGMVGRVLSGSTIVDAAERDVLQGWFLGQKGMSRPGAIVPNSSVNDLWVVWMSEFSYQQVGPTRWEVGLTFKEIPRKRWP